METIYIVEIIISGISLMLFILFLVAIKRNSDNIFFSMRSSNLMNITNILILLSIASYSLNDIFFKDLEDSDNKGLKYISTFYSIFQLAIFFSLSIRYFRLYLSCRNSEDSNVQINFFEPKAYHYEYCYVRLIAIFIFLTLGTFTLVFFFADPNLTLSHEILINNDKNETIPYFYWMITSFIETIVYMTFILLIVRTHLNPNVYIVREIILVSLINYCYSLSMILSFINKDIESDILKAFIRIIPLIYNLLIYFVVIALPFLYGVFNTTVILYDLPGELCSSLYLFLTKEKCYDAFHDYLKNKDVGGNKINPEAESDKCIYYLEFLISIFKYRLLVTNNDSRDLIREELDYILEKYLDKPQANDYFGEQTIKELFDACSALRANLKNRNTQIFDKIAAEIYQFLDKEFEQFKLTNEFNDLKNELTEETNIRCKLTNFGLIRN